MVLAAAIPHHSLLRATPTKKSLTVSHPKKAGIKSQERGIDRTPIVTLTASSPAWLPRTLARRRLPLCMWSPPCTPSILPAALLCRSPCDPHHIGVCIYIPDPARLHPNPFTGDKDLWQQKLGGRPHVPPPDPARSTTRCANPFSFWRRPAAAEARRAPARPSPDPARSTTGCANPFSCPAMWNWGLISWWTEC